MKSNRWIAFPLAGLAAIAIGVAAVEAAPSPSPSTGTSSKNYAQVFVQKLAAILGLSTTQTQNDLKNAELQTLDQMLADGRITQQQYNALRARIQNGNGVPFGPGGGGFRGGFPGGFQGHGALAQLRSAELNAIASALKMSTTDLQNALRSGTTLSQLESKQGVSAATVNAAAKKAAKGVLDSAMKAGTITQAQEDAVLARIGSGQFGVFGFRGGFKHGPEAPGQAPSATPGATPAAYFSTI